MPESHWDDEICLLSYSNNNTTGKLSFKSVPDDTAIAMIKPYSFSVVANAVESNIVITRGNITQYYIQKGIYTGRKETHKIHPRGLYSLRERTSYRMIMWSLEATRFGCRLFQSLWILTGNSRLFQSLWILTGNSAAALPRCLSHFRATWSLWQPISRLRGFTRFGGKTS